MENIDLNKYLSEHSDLRHIKDKYFDITTRIDLTRGLTFENCRFYFHAESMLNGTEINFKLCHFIGTKKKENYEHTWNTQFSKCDLQFVYFSGEFGGILIDRSEIYTIEDTSKSINYTITGDSKIHNFFLYGECVSLNLNGSLFQADNFKGIWNKKVSKNASCKKTIFDRCDVNPFYFATKCDDKTSLDLSSARLIDNWSRLRKNYAGISLFIVLFLSLIFFLPLITHSFFLLLASKVEISFIEPLKVPLWKVLLFGGKSGFEAITYFLFTCALLTYNVLRIWMTISIAKLREEEKFLADSNFKLVSIDPEKYTTQLLVEKILKFLLWVSILYSILKLKDTLLIEVPLY